MQQYAIIVPVQHITLQMSQQSNMKMVAVYSVTFLLQVRCKRLHLSCFKKYLI